jgi:hypothetical protein
MSFPCASSDPMYGNTEHCDTLISLSQNPGNNHPGNDKIIHPQNDQSGLFTPLPPNSISQSTPNELENPSKIHGSATELSVTPPRVLKIIITNA